MIFRELSQQCTEIAKQAAGMHGSVAPEIQNEIQLAVAGLMQAKSRLIRAEWKAEAMKDGAP